jgi:hypothetical protein
MLRLLFTSLFLARGEISQHLSDAGRVGSIASSSELSVGESWTFTRWKVVVKSVVPEGYLDAILQELSH